MPKTLNINAELAALETLAPKALREKYLEAFGELSRSGNRRFLIKRIAWRLQANAEGDLPERVRQKALEMARDSDLRTTMPKPRSQPVADGITVTRQISVGAGLGRDNFREPMPGSQLTRVYKGRRIVVTVLHDGFEHAGQKYRSLSAVAKAVTGTHLSGQAFFGMRSRRHQEASA